jgi:ubiquinone/menaquinone biosynthesis C-methylase UbiE
VAAGIGDLYDAVVDAFFSDLPAGSRLLDLGCGSGQVAIRIAKRNPQAFVLGLDLSQGQITRARSRGLGLPNLGFGVVDALCLPLPDDCFDFVVSVAMVKHLPDRGLGLDQMQRICKQGGSVCVIEVDKGLSWEATKNFVGRWRWVFPGTRPLLYAYFRRFVAGQGLSVQELSALYEDAGFSSVQAQKTPGLPFVIGMGAK